MLTNHGGDFPFKMTELYEKIELSQNHYSRWVKLNLLSSFYPFKDFKEVLSPRESTSKGGQIRAEYLLTKRTAEELSLLSKTPKGKELRKWLLDLKDRVESNELLTIEQFYFLIDLVHAFSFVVNQKAIEATHQQKFIKDYIDKTGRFNLKFAFAEFHNYRNEILNIEPETISERILRFCDDENAFSRSFF